MTELEMFAKLPQLNGNWKKDQEGGYLPILSKCIDGKYRLSYDCCYAFLFHIKHVHKLQHIFWALGLDANLKI